MYVNVVYVDLSCKYIPAYYRQIPSIFTFILMFKQNKGEVIELYIMLFGRAFNKISPPYIWYLYKHFRF